MEFFKELFELSNGLSMTMRIMRKDDKLTISVLPDEVKDVLPLLITGTAEELDAEFINTIRVPLENTKSMMHNVKEYGETLQETTKKEIAAIKSVEDKRVEEAKLQKPRGGTAAASIRNKPVAKPARKKAAPSKKAAVPAKSAPKKDAIQKIVAAVNDLETEGEQLTIV